MSKSPGPEHLIVSLHIPKTGGTSFSEVLDLAYPGQVAFFYRETNKLTHPKLRNRDRLRDPAMMAELEADGIRIIHGHAPAGWLLQGVPDQQRYWTWLRDPIERVISAYYYQLRRQEAGRKVEKVDGHTLEDFARSERNRNGQARMLRGLDLAQMGFVGITERFDESLVMLGLEDHQPKKKRKRNKSKPEIDAATKQMIAELNAEDMELYQLGLRLFEARNASA